MRELRERGAVGNRWTSTRGNDIGGRRLDKGSVYRVLTNRVYPGEAVHKGQSYPGEHDAIVPEDLWAKAQAIMTTSPRVRANATRRQTPAPLKGLMRCAHCEAAMSPTQSRLTTSFVCRMLSLTTLAPDMVRDVLDGRATAELCLTRLSGSFPTLWEDQRGGAVQPAI